MQSSMLYFSALTIFKPITIISGILGLLSFLVVFLVICLRNRKIYRSTLYIKSRYLLPYLRFKKTLLNIVNVMCIQETKTFVEFQAIKSSFPVPYMRKCFTPTDLSFCFMVFFLISCYEIEYNITCQVRLIKRHIRFFSKSHFGIWWCCKLWQVFFTDFLSRFVMSTNLGVILTRITIINLACTHV